MLDLQVSYSFVCKISHDPGRYRAYRNRCGYKQDERIGAEQTFERRRSGLMRLSHGTTPPSAIYLLYLIDPMRCVNSFTSQDDYLEKDGCSGPRSCERPPPTHVESGFLMIPNPRIRHCCHIAQQALSSVEHLMPGSAHIADGCPVSFTVGFGSMNEPARAGGEHASRSAHFRQREAR